MSSTPVDRAIRVLEVALGELKKDAKKEKENSLKATQNSGKRPAGKPSPLQTVSTIRWRDSLRG